MKYSRVFQSLFKKLPARLKDIGTPFPPYVKDALERQTILQLKQLIRKAKPYVLFSGGKDSLVTLSLVKKASELVGIHVTAIHADTTIGLPENLDYVRSVSHKLGVELVIVKPNDDYFTLAMRKGFPRFNARWCCGELKIKPMRNYIRRQPNPKMIFDGVRAEESKVRSAFQQFSWHKQFNCYVYHPILHWNAVDVKAYLQRNNIKVNPLYEKGFKRASECWCGVFKSIKEFELLYLNYPQFFNRLVELEASMRSGGSYLFKSGERIYLRDIKQKLKEYPFDKSTC